MKFLLILTLGFVASCDASASSRYVTPINHVRLEVEICLDRAKEMLKVLRENKEGSGYPLPYIANMERFLECSRSGLQELGVTRGDLEELFYKNRERWMKDQKKILEKGTADYIGIINLLRDEGKRHPPISLLEVEITNEDLERYRTLGCVKVAENHLKLAAGLKDPVAKKFQQQYAAKACDKPKPASEDRYANK